MRSLSGMAAQAGAIVLLWTIQPAASAEELVPLPSGVPHASTPVGLPGPECAPLASDICDLRPHPYAVFWRGYCLCESMCLQAKLDRFRYPDHLRHRQYVEAQSVTAGSLGTFSHGPLASDHSCATATHHVPARGPWAGSVASCFPGRPGPR